MTNEGLLVSGAGPVAPSGGRPLGPDGAPATPALHPADLDRDPSAVLTLLEPDQLVGAKAAHLGLRPVSRGLRVLLWALRAYVVFMLIVVAIQVVRSLHGGGAGG